MAVIASIRHHHSNYDKLLMQGLDRASDRQEVQEEIEEVLKAWQASVTGPTGPAR